MIAVLATLFNRLPIQQRMQMLDFTPKEYQSLSNQDKRELIRLLMNDKKLQLVLDQELGSLEQNKSINGQQIVAALSIQQYFKTSLKIVSIKKALISA